MCSLITTVNVSSQYYGEIVMRLSTHVTPGADHAARSASSLSAQERTAPFKMTWLPWVSTVILFASVSTLRTSAFSISALISEGFTRGLTVIKLTTPLTPDRL